MPVPARFGHEGQFGNKAVILRAKKSRPDATGFRNRQYHPEDNPARTGSWQFSVATVPDPARQCCRTSCETPFHQLLSTDWLHPGWQDDPAGESNKSGPAHPAYPEPPYPSHVLL